MSQTVNSKRLLVRYSSLGFETDPFSIFCGDLSFINTVWLRAALLNLFQLWRCISCNNNEIAANRKCDYEGILLLIFSSCLKISLKQRQTFSLFPPSVFISVSLCSRCSVGALHRPAHHIWVLFESALLFRQLGLKTNRIPFSLRVPISIYNANTLLLTPCKDAPVLHMHNDIMTVTVYVCHPFFMAN